MTQPFSPLLIGEVIVTIESLITTREIIAFQSPFNRGSDCNRSHPKRQGFPSRTFSPLFIGKVIVTLRTSGDLVLGTETFSPLFIGEVIVTRACLEAVNCEGHLSVPFSSGK